MSRKRRVQCAFVRCGPTYRFAVGVHPHQAGEFTGRVADACEIVRRGAAQGHACAIGEIGLDYHYDFSPRAVQLEIFRAQIELALELRLPVVIHTREATDDTFAIMRDAGGGRLRGVFHCLPATRRWHVRRSTRTSTCRSRESSRSRAPSRFARLRESFPPTAFWPKRTRHIWPRFRTAASATNRRLSPRSLRKLAEIRESRWRISPASCAAISSRSLEVWRKLLSSNGLAR